MNLSALVSQLGLDTEFDPTNPLMYIYIISLAIIPIFMMYGQKMQSKVILGEVSKSLTKLKTMKDNARLDTIDYVRAILPDKADPSARVDKFLEYFTIMPVTWTRAAWCARSST